jgi:hypothetical protein
MNSAPANGFYLKCDLKGSMLRDSIAIISSNKNLIMSMDHSKNFKKINLQ